MVTASAMAASSSPWRTAPWRSPAIPTASGPSPSNAALPFCRRRGSARDWWRRRRNATAPSAAASTMSPCGTRAARLSPSSGGIHAHCPSGCLRPRRSREREHVGRTIDDRRRRALHRGCDLHHRCRTARPTGARRRTDAGTMAGQLSPGRGHAGKFGPHRRRAGLLGHLSTGRWALASGGPPARRQLALYAPLHKAHQRCPPPTAELRGGVGGRPSGCDLGSVACRPQRLGLGSGLGLPLGRALSVEGHAQRHRTWPNAPSQRRKQVLDLTPRKGDLDPIETASRDEIAGLQLARLRQTLRHVYDNVPHYRSAFDARGVTPDDLGSLADLAKFPFTSKADLRATYPFGLFAVPRERVARIHASSGTTGKPTVVGYTKGDIDTWAGLVARSIRAAGGRPGMRLHNAYGYGLFTGGLGLHYGAERLGVTVVPVSGGMTERQVQLIADFEPDIITVTPSYMLAILDEFRRQNIDPRATSLKVGIFGAEPWTNSMRQEIEQACDMHAVDIYGLSEVMARALPMSASKARMACISGRTTFIPRSSIR